MAQPFFSVVIDNFNYGRFLGQAIESLLAQDFPAGEREIIVVDDGSTDESAAVAESFKDKIRLIKQRNQGQAAAFQAGFDQARGQAVCLLDSDDYFHPQKLSKVAAALQDERVGMVQHYLRDVDATGNPLNNPLPRWPTRYTLEHMRAGRCENAATSGLVFRRRLLDAALPVPAGLFAFYDEYLIYRGLFFGEMLNVAEILGYHRIHGLNNWANRNSNPDKLEGYVRQFKLLNGSIGENLAERGLRFEPRFEALQRMEVARSEILMHMERGQRKPALEVWRKLWASDGRTRFGFFRCATCLIALASPRLYLRLYSLYGDFHWLARAREKALPTPR